MQNLKPLTVLPRKTSVFNPGDDLFGFLATHLSSSELEGNALALTSKIVSLAESRTVAKDQITKKDLIIREADRHLTEGLHGVELTLTRGILIPSAGIDESNSERDDYILYPQDPYESAKHIHRFLKNHFGLKNLALILTDSHSSPLRRGVNGIALAHWGFKATKSLVGSNDMFGKPLKFTYVNVADALASMAVFAMGEGNEGTPLALISGAAFEFTETTTKEEVQILPEDDIYFPLLSPYLDRK